MINEVKWKNMRIALLNLQYDNNYGGNLQRYALMTVLERMGHDVTHLNLRFNFNPQPWYVKFKRLPRRVIYKLLKNRDIDIFPEYHRQKEYEQQCLVTDQFYNKYIKHTKIIDGKEKLRKQRRYDLYLVGSDQVWRKTIAAVYGIDTFFFDFLTDNSRRIAYGVSFGTDTDELNEDDKRRLTPLYEKFEAVSVREPSGLELLQLYGWTKPQAEWVLDPTLLLSRKDYEVLISAGNTVKPKGELFCYILDASEEKRKFIEQQAKKHKLVPFVLGLSGGDSIEQWLRSFSDAKLIITDSYHGLVFSIIFNKPFILIRNKFRGNARFDAIFEVCNIHSDDGTQIDWMEVNHRVEQKREFALKWLNNNI